MNKNPLVLWLRNHLFASALNISLTVLVLFLALLVLPFLISWFFIDSTVIGTAEDCRQNSGACWAFVVEKYKLILVWRYPRDQLWRPILSLLFFLGSIIYVSNFKKWNRYTPVIFFVGTALTLYLLYGGLFLPVVEIRFWGGLILTIFLTAVGLFFAYPIAILLALGRRSNLPAIRTISTLYIEIIRGVPLISLLFMASVMLPFVIPTEWTLGKLTRAQLAIVMFASAYQAEVIRGGLQGINRGQYEAIKSLGLSYWQGNFLIVLPQALKIVIPPTMNTFIAVFLDTSLLIIISMFDLMGTAKASLTDYQWLGFSSEAYIFIAVIYFIFCFSIARYSISLEKKLKTTH